MKIIKIKASDLYEKINRYVYACNFTSSERSERGKFLVIILPKSYSNLQIAKYLYACIIKIHAMDLHL